MGGRFFFLPFPHIFLILELWQTKSTIRWSKPRLLARQQVRR